MSNPAEREELRLKHKAEVEKLKRQLSWEKRLQGQRLTRVDSTYYQVLVFDPEGLTFEDIARAARAKEAA